MRNYYKCVGCGECVDADIEHGKCSECGGTKWLAMTDGKERKQTMKTVEECLDMMIAINLKFNTKHKPTSEQERQNCLTSFREMFKQIQLDAMKEGMRRAAKV